MDKKILVWIMGSHGSGKTTANKLLLQFLTNGEQPKEVIGEEKGLNYYYTKYSNGGIATLGKMGKNQCTGLDSLYTQLKSEGVTKCLEKALDDKDVKLITVECVFATMAWYKDWVRKGLRERFELLVIHLDFTMWENFNRISQRRAAKLGRQDWWNIPLEDTVYKNCGSKNREIRTIYNKLNGTHPTENVKLADECIQLNASEEIKVLQEQIINFIFNHL